MQCLSWCQETRKRTPSHQLKMGDDLRQKDDQQTRCDVVVVGVVVHADAAVGLGEKAAATGAGESGSWRRNARVAAG